MLRALPPVHGAGLPALVIDYRNDPGAPEDPSGRYGYGATEWLDLEAAVQAALDRGAHDVVLVGWSMGGAITAAFLEQSELADRVVGIVLDAPMLDLGATVDDEAADRSLPLVGLPIPGALTWTAKQLAAVRYDLDWNALDYVDDTAWLDVPTLVFHGTVDDTVPVAIARDLARAEPELVELRETGSASHLESWNRDRASYEDALRSFLRTWGGEDDGGSADG
jgi:pimeloyl-ACP methyl ester carboxylesterase